MVYKKKLWKTGDIMKQEDINNIENGIYEAHQELQNLHNYDDTVIKNDIKNIKTDLGTAQLTTTAKDVKGAVNEVNSQCKDIEQKKIYQFSNIELMKKCNLKTGCVCETLGYYTANDGGHAKYYIVDVDNIGIEGFTIKLENNLYAELIIENNTINFRQLGATDYKPNSTHYDNKKHIESYMNFLKQSNNRPKLFIPAGVWETSEFEFTGRQGFDIEGQYTFPNSVCKGSVIVPYNNNQSYVWQLGSSEEMLSNFSLKNILFSTCNVRYNLDQEIIMPSDDMKTIGTALNIIHSEFGKIDVQFNQIRGRAMKITSSWEIEFGTLIFRAITNHKSSILEFGECVKTLNNNANLSALKFDYIQFEGIHGDCIKFEYRCKLINSNFGIINVEDTKYTANGEIYKLFSDNDCDYDEANDTHYYIMNFDRGADVRQVVFNTIELNNISYRYSTLNNERYALDSVMKFGYFAGCGITINNINCIGLTKNLRIIHQKEEDTQHFSNYVIINNILSDDNSLVYYFDVKGFTRLVCNNAIITNYLNAENQISSFIPFYKVLNIHGDNDRGQLYYDENCFNDLKLAVKPILSRNSAGTGFRDRTIFKQVSNGTTFKFRAKIPNGESIDYTLGSNETGEYVAFNCVGTGNFRWYTIDISSKFTEPTMLLFKTSTKNTSIDALLDCYQFV